MLGIMLPNLCLRRESPLRWAFLLRIAMTTWLALDWTKCQGDTLSVLLCSDTEHNPDFWFCQGGTGGKRRISLAMFQIFYNVLCNVPRKSLIIKISSNVPNVPSNFVTLETRIARPPSHSASPSSLLILVMEPVISLY